MASQLRRAAISIPLNIAEGAGSSSGPEFQRFLTIALKSTYEAMTALEIARRLAYLSEEQTLALCNEADHIAAMITRLANTIGDR